MSYKHLFQLSPSVCECNATQARAAMVNNSGELGAKQIYLGQIKAAKQKNFPQQTINELIEMLESELEHLQYFQAQIRQNKNFKPSSFDLLWKPFSFYLGYVSTIFDIQIAMLLTKQVETVIEQHYKEQIGELQNAEANEQFIAKIAKFLADEIHHKHTGEQQSQNLSPMLKMVLEPFFAKIVKIAIFISSRV